MSPEHEAHLRQQVEYRCTEVKVSKFALRDALNEIDRLRDIIEDMRDKLTKDVLG